MAHTKRDLTLTAWGATFTLPNGTAVHKVKNASGTEGDLWAVTSTALLIDLTGNTHDPKYRYCFVPESEVAFANP